MQPEAAPILEAVNLETATHERVSFTVHRGDIQSIYVPSGRPRHTLVRTIAGDEKPCGGELRVFGTPRIAVVRGALPLTRSVELLPDLVLLDVDERVDRDAWVRMAAARELGQSFLVTTANPENAYRCDHTALALSLGEDIPRDIAVICGRMRGAVAALLAVLDARRTGTLRDVDTFSAQLRCLNAAARDLLAEARRTAATQREVLDVLRLSADVASVRIDERVLDKLAAAR